MTLPRRLPADVGVATPGWLGERLRTVVQMFAPDTRTAPEWLWVGALAVAALMGGRVLGPPGAAGAAGLVLLVPVVGPSLVQRRLMAVDRRRLPERAGAIARAVRSGASIPDALARAAADDLPTARRWRQLAEQVELGRPLDDALAAESAGTASAERLLLATQNELALADIEYGQAQQVLLHRRRPQPQGQATGNTGQAPGPPPRHQQ